MRKLILSMMVSVDGFIEDRNKDISWHIWADEMNQYMLEFFKTVDTILLGRVSYQLMENYWPSAASSTENPAIVDVMNNYQKNSFFKNDSGIQLE